MHIEAQVVPYRMSAVALDGFIALSVALVETWAILLWFDWQVDGATLLALHVILTSLLIARAWRLQRIGQDWRFAGVLAAATAAFSVFGAWGSIVAAMALWLGHGQVGSIGWWESLVADEAREPGLYIEKESSATHEGAVKRRVNSVRHVMSVGTYTEKMKLIAALSRAPRPELMSLLRDAVNDRDAAVRVQAATVIERFEHRFTQKWLVLSKRLASQDHDSEACMALADHCDEYAYLGVADAARRADVRADAIQLYRRVLEGNPNYRRVALLLTRILVRDGNYVDAIAVRAQAGGEFESIGEILWYCEALFGLREFDRLRRTLSDHVKAKYIEQMPTKVKNAVALWQGAVAIAAAK